jgi:hypothetical protein
MMRYARGAFGDAKPTFGGGEIATADRASAIFGGFQDVIRFHNLRSSIKARVILVGARAAKSRWPGRGGSRLKSCAV